MNEYNEGDLVEAVKGETRIGGRLKKELGDGIGIADMGWPITSLESEGFTITVVKKAKTKVMLPIEPGSVVRIANDEDRWHWLGWLAKDGTWDVIDFRGSGRTAIPDLILWIEEQGEVIGSVAVLESRAVTAKAVLDHVRGYAGAEGFTAQIEATAKKFGVTND